MRRLDLASGRTAAEAGEIHRASQARVYELDKIQAYRIENTRRMLARAIAATGKPFVKIVELGCGTGDISGPFSEAHHVCGYDINAEALKEAERRYPKMIVEHDDIAKVRPQNAQIVVMCEVLEHVVDPVAMVSEWLPRCEQSIISHPLDEDIDCAASGGEHCWSLDEEDFVRWFALGGHVVSDRMAFEMGSYRVVLGRGSKA